MIGYPKELSAYCWTLDPNKKYKIEEYKEKKRFKCKCLLSFISK